MIRYFYRLCKPAFYIWSDMSVVTALAYKTSSNHASVYFLKSFKTVDIVFNGLAYLIYVRVSQNQFEQS